MHDKNFSISRFSPSLQKLCRLPSPPARSSSQTSERIDYVEQFSLTDDDISSLLEIVRWYGKELDTPHEDIDGFWHAPLHAWNALMQLDPKRVVPEVLEVINHLDLTRGGWIEDLSSPLVGLVIRDAGTIPLLLAAMQEDQRHEDTHSLILEAARYASRKTSHYERFHEILVDQLKELRLDSRDYYASIVCELAFTENMAQELKELLRKVCLEGFVNLNIVACNDGLKEHVGIDFEDDPALRPILDEFEEVDKILRSFQNCDRTFPKQAVLKAREYRERIIPSLIEAVRNETAYARFEVYDDDGIAHFAVHLLAEFQAKEALPAVLDSLSLTEDQCYDYLYGDSLFESLHGILYRLIGNDLNFYDEKLRDANTPPVLRTRLLEALPYLVKDGTLGEDKFFELLAEYLRIAIDEKNKKFVTDLICDIYCSENPKYWPLAQEAFDGDLVDEVMIGRESVKSGLHGKPLFGPLGMQRLMPHSDFSDTIEEMERWASFHPEPKYDTSSQHHSPSALGIDDEWEDEEDDLFSECLKPVQKVGRNDPCPCGSGKKYKKCCLK